MFDRLPRIFYAPSQAGPSGSKILRQESVPIKLIYLYRDFILTRGSFAHRAGLWAIVKIIHAYRRRKRSNLLRPLQRPQNIICPLKVCPHIKMWLQSAKLSIIKQKTSLFVTHCWSLRVSPSPFRVDRIVHSERSHRALAPSPATPQPESWFRQWS